MNQSIVDKSAQNEQTAANGREIYYPESDNKPHPGALKAYQVQKGEIYYPESDGKSVGETDWHISVIFYLRQALRFLFRHVDDVYTATTMLFYYEEGEPTDCKVPDVFVVKGVTKQDRRVYKLWEEKIVPCVIFEVTSRGTRWQDVGEKKGLYEFLGVKEYFLFDPLGEYLKPRLQGFQIVGEHYEPLKPAQDGALTSSELNIILRPVGNLLRVIDRNTDEEIPSLEEAAEKAVEALERADAAEAELARLRAELAQLKKQQTGQ